MRFAGLVNHTRIEQDPFCRSIASINMRGDTDISTRSGSRATGVLRGGAFEAGETLQVSHEHSC